MGIRSDVALAMKKSLVEKLAKEQSDQWFRYCENVISTDEGSLYVWKDVKWYIDVYEELKEMYAWLSNQDAKDFLIVEACQDYPESTDGDLGSWTSNPWDIHRVVSVSLYIDSDEVL